MGRLEYRIMHKLHPSFEELQPEKVLWRYMNLEKYISLVSKRQLFFCRADKFEDPFEGQLNQTTKLSLQEWFMQEIPRENRTEAHNLQSKKQLNAYLAEIEKQKTKIFITSWHQKNCEDFAMWKIYSNWNTGIAIKSDYGKLKSSFEKNKESIYIGKIKYFDETKDLINPSNALTHSLPKEIIFFMSRKSDVFINIIKKRVKNNIKGFI